MSDRRYAQHLARRENERQRALMGETLAAFHAREVARPPTLAEIYAANHTNRERCPMTVDLFLVKQPGRGSAT